MRNRSTAESGIFGKTGLVIPPVVYGTSYLGNLYRRIDDRVKMEIMKNWFETAPPPVCIDTAGKYGAGLALEVIGKGLEAMQVAPGRILISNKLGWYRIPLVSEEPGFEPGVWAGMKHDAIQKISYNGILECHAQGNRLLGGKYKPQLVSVHDPDEYLATAENLEQREKIKEDIRSAYRALFELKEKREVVAVGIGAKDWHVIRELYEDISFDWVMLANSLTLYRHPTDIVDFINYLSENGVGIINSAIFNAGFLTGGEYFDYRKIDPSLVCDREKMKWRAAFFKVCEAFGVEPGHACIQFALSPPGVHAIALNPSKPERIQKNFDILRSPLPSEFWETLKENHLIHPDYPHI